MHTWVSRRNSLWQFSLATPRPTFQAFKALLMASALLVASSNAADGQAVQASNRPGSSCIRAVVESETFGDPTHNGIVTLSFTSRVVASVQFNEPILRRNHHGDWLALNKKQGWPWLADATSANKITLADRTVMIQFIPDRVEMRQRISEDELSHFDTLPWTLGLSDQQLDALKQAIEKSEVAHPGFPLSLRLELLDRNKRDFAILNRDLSMREFAALPPASELLDRLIEGLRVHMFTDTPVQIIYSPDAIQRLQGGLTAEERAINDWVRERGSRVKVDGIKLTQIVTVEMELQGGILLRARPIVLSRNEFHLENQLLLLKRKHPFLAARPSALGRVDKFDPENDRAERDHRQI